MIIPKKILVIKLINPLPDLEMTAKESLATLEKSVSRILNGEIIETSLQELYTITENLRNSHTEILLVKLEELIEAALAKKLVELTNNPEHLPVMLNHIWIEFCNRICVLKNIYLPCNKMPKAGNVHYNAVHNIGMNIFKNVIVFNPFIRGCLTFDLLYLIQSNRKGERIESKLLKSLLFMLQELQVHNEIFHEEFLKITYVFFLDEAKILINAIDVRAYLNHAQARMSQEQEMAESFPDKIHSNVIDKILCKSFIEDNQTLILDKMFNLLFRKEVKEELSTLYKLLKKVPFGLKNLSRYFSEYVVDKGKQIINKPENDKMMIQDLINFKDDLNDMLLFYFDSNESCSDLLRNAFSKVININHNKLAQLLAKFIDTKLRSKDITEEELENYLNKAVIVFRYIQGKDIFEAFYKKDLARRLLLGKSTSQDAEDSMIGKLKSECGSAFTAKIEGMFKDINISEGMNNAFKQHLRITEMPTISDLCINVLTSSFWPTYPTYQVNLPSELAHYQNTFQKFYATNHSGRKLVWQPNLGHCLLKAAFDCGQKELQVSLFQTIVLLLFNDNPKFTFSEIQELTNIEEEELKRTLFSLACYRGRVLLKESKHKDIRNDDIFSYNNCFCDKLFRVKINQIQLKESFDERETTEKNIQVDRQFQIDAAIVRILKNKKRIKHNELISELFNALDIPVKSYDLKKRIELLIEREYMERDKDNPAYYTYIA